MKRALPNLLSSTFSKFKVEKSPPVSRQDSDLSIYFLHVATVQYEHGSCHEAVPSRFLLQHWFTSTFFTQPPNTTAQHF